jgi:NAD-dependent dihydropyrimidine dehydrogenase PreA subunit
MLTRILTAIVVLSVLSACQQGVDPADLTEDENRNLEFVDQENVAMYGATPMIPAGHDFVLYDDIARYANGGFPPIGEAEIDTRVCLAWNRSVCWTCYDACPLQGSALKLTAGRPVVDTTACSGCGQCEFACPAGNRGIVVKPVC